MGKGRSFVAGALAGAAALFLSKKENRDKVAKKAKELGKEAKKEVAVVKEKVEDIKEEVGLLKKKVVNATKKTTK